MGGLLQLYPTPHKAVHRFPPAVEQFLHKYSRYIQREAEHYRERFNFAFAAEEAHKRFGDPLHQNSIRRFALCHGYYHPQPREKGEVSIRFETSGPGALFQHDASRHCWLPERGGINTCC